ncbi:MAG: hypothetical protein HYV09_34195 [Deltaproteobacteria bacterium]|nr:hypothetical protein [Deltaproteobacteria bacterium]
MRAALLVALPLVSLGCARNAFLELDLDLPKNESGVDRHAVVRIVSGARDFAEDWQSGDPVPGAKLSTTQRTLHRLSIEADGDSETTPVRVKVRFCKDPNCAALGDDIAPEVRLHIERAFYIGQRTSYAWMTKCIPNVVGQTDSPTCDVADKAQTVAAKCDIGGCRSGSTRSYCTGGKHFCEE